MSETSDLAESDCFDGGKGCYAQSTFEGLAKEPCVLAFTVLRASKNPKARTAHLEVVCASVFWQSLATVLTSGALFFVWATLALWCAAGLLWLRSWKFRPA